MADRDPAMARLEALLLLAREPLSSRKLAHLADLADGTKARTLVRALNSRYDSQGCAFRAEEVAGGFQLLTRPQFAPWLRRLDSAAVDVRLSAPAMETLAVVAYRQPVLRAEVEAVRGVQCGEILRQLIERDLVRVTGRSDDLGRPLLYGTTRRFLRVFGLRHLDELPRPATIPAAMPEPCSDTISEDNCPNATSTPQTVSEESKVTTLTRPPHKSTWRSEEQPLQEAEFLKVPMRNGLDEDEDDFEDDDFEDEEEDDDDEYETEEEEEEEEEEDELDDDLDEEPWEEVEDEDEDEDEDDDDWDDDDDDLDDDDDWDDDDWDEDE
ncbi:MAG: SMC-Scp complex subunit ScpB [Thermoguttaceae bacterium]|nr:SMC-Scp complex subunit ScpB [Thermoguttaceae bacterium]